MSAFNDLSAREEKVTSFKRSYLLADGTRSWYFKEMKNGSILRLSYTILISSKNQPSFHEFWWTLYNQMSSYAYMNVISQLKNFSDLAQVTGIKGCTRINKYFTSFKKQKNAMIQSTESRARMHGLDPVSISYQLCDIGKNSYLFFPSVPSQVKCRH